MLRTPSTAKLLPVDCTRPHVWIFACEWTLDECQQRCSVVLNRECNRNYFDRVTQTVIHVAPNRHGPFPRLDFSTGDGHGVARYLLRSTSLWKRLSRLSLGSVIERESQIVNP